MNYIDKSKIKPKYTKFSQWKEYSVWNDTLIAGFFGLEEHEYKWLSNFHPCRVSYRGC